MDKITSLVGSICLLVLVIIWAAFWTGLSLSVLWNWFIAPKFILPSLGILEAYGVALVVATLRPKRVNPDGASKFAEYVIMAPLSTGVILATGWVVKIWV